MQQVKIKTPAKINLYLSISSRRDDGYHNLESFMLPIKLFDELTFTRSGTTIQTTCNSNPELTGETNLAHKAARAWMDEAGVQLGVQIEIQKNIPIQAGLGGGSSDAAATLKALQLLGKKPLPENRLHRVATRLGADVAFFLDPLPRIVRGIGEILGPRQFPEPFWLLLGVAPFGLATREVFENLIIPLTNIYISANDEPPRKWRFDELIWLIKNDLQPMAEKIHPEIARVRKIMKNAGASNSGMSGSGPSVFSIFKDKKSARKVLKKIDGNLGWTYLLLRAIT